MRLWLTFVMTSTAFLQGVRVRTGGISGGGVRRPTQTACSGDDARGARHGELKRVEFEDAIIIFDIIHMINIFNV